MSKVSEDKRFSAASAATLGQLEGLDERFGAMTSAADAIEALLDAGSVPAARLVEAKHELAQLNGDLEKVGDNIEDCAHDVSDAFTDDDFAYDATARRPRAVPIHAA